jgi:uncharacterized damage-inducible protein DinB
MDGVVECLHAFERIERERRAALAALSEWPAESLRFRPTPGAWSAPEVLDHIVRAEAGTIADVANGLERPHPLGKEVRPGIAALREALRCDAKYQVPADATMIHPDTQSALDEVVARWELARQRLRSLLENLTPNDTSIGVFRHPFAGWMTVQEVIEHFSDHLYHHQFQLERLHESWAKSGATNR